WQQPLPAAAVARAAGTTRAAGATGSAAATGTAGTSLVDTSSTPPVGTQVATSAPAARITSYVPTLPPWPMVGRDEALGQLLHALDQADSGVPAIAALVGDPGIGKSRLASELAHSAGQRGATVLLGRCSQDDGAPPLWPWQQVLRGLGRDLPEEDGREDGGARFRTW